MAAPGKGLAIFSLSRKDKYNPDPCGGVGDGENYEKSAVQIFHEKEFF